MESIPYDNMCVALLTSTKMTAIKKTRLIMITIVKKTCFLGWKKGAVRAHADVNMLFLPISTCITQYSKTRPWLFSLCEDLVF